MSVQFEGMMALDDYYIQLMDDNIDDAGEFKEKFWETRTERGLRSKIFPASEVIEFYDKFKTRK